jgi:hypothetical protein
MGVPWWGWLLILIGVLLYAAPGVLAFVALFRMKPMPALPDEDWPPRRPWPKWILYPVTFLVLISCWPIVWLFLWWASRRWRS